MELGVFPLPIFLLPGGKAKLRIFEPRYIRLVKESFSNGGFVLSIFDKNQSFNTNKNGVIVDIVNFDTLDDGLLSIDVQAKELVTLSNPQLEHDGLLKAEIKKMKHWTNEGKTNSLENKSDMVVFLKNAFLQSSHLNQLYDEKKLEDTVWVCARILEILPITALNKSKINTLSFEQCQNFMHTIIKGK